MELVDLLSRLRGSDRLDDAVEEYQYPTADLTRALNEAVRQAAIRMRLLRDSRSEECCTYAVDAGEDPEWVLLHPRVLALRSARWSGSTCPLTLTTLKVMDKDRPDWPSEAAGTPTHVIVDAQSGYVRLWPTPDADGTLTCAVWRSPLESEELEDLGDEPVIDETYHEGLLDWAQAQVLRGRDGETSDLQRAADAEARFTATFGRLPSAHEIQCWGTQPPRGQRAEFI